MKKTKRQSNVIARYGLSQEAGHLIELDGRPYITHAGLLEVANQEGCAGISVLPVLGLCDTAKGRWVFKATVHRQGSTLGFDGLGDADPTNVSALVLGAELRVAETRAVNRALRKAYGIGLCSAEELGSANHLPPTPARTANPTRNGNVTEMAKPQPLLRDELQRVIRQHKLDPAQVKRYAADFCGTESLRDASRELVEDFVRVLKDAAENDRTGLLCRLNAYNSESQEAA
jgi:hypothetical protein